MQCAGERASLDNLPVKTDIYRKVQHYDCRRALFQDEGCGLKRLPSVTPTNPPLPPPPPPPLCTPQQTTERQNFTVLERQNEKEITENSQSRKLSFWCICFKPIYLSIKEYFCLEVLQKMLKTITSKRENAKLTTLRGLLSLLRYVQFKSN